MINGITIVTVPRPHARNTPCPPRPRALNVHSSGCNPEKRSAHEWPAARGSTRRDEDDSLRWRWCRSCGFLKRAVAYLMSESEVDDRIIRLETAVAHLQHDLEQMHQALVSLHAELKGSRDQLGRLERRLQQLGEPPEMRDPGEERPPHY